jgi:hypothetical protein
MDPAGAIDAWLDRVPVRREVLEIVRATPQAAYLVGGTVRDALLGRDSDDLDLAVDGRAMALARRVADRIGGAYVVMDAERDVARVLRRAGGRRQQFDFAGLRAEGIVSDLRARDFTVNAMALRVARVWGEVLDPTGGRGDLAARRLRAASPRAFRDDPLRILRGVRLSGALGFSLTADTEALARAWLPALAGVSAERIRDEWLATLALADPVACLELAERLGAAAQVLPEAAVDPARWGRALATLGGLVDLERALRRGKAGEWAPLAGPLLERAEEEISPGRRRGLVQRLVGLLADVEDPGAVAGRLRLSSREVRTARRTVGAGRQLLGDPPLGPLGVYRYYRAHGEDGVEGAVLAVARAGGESGTSARARDLVAAWFHRYGEVVDPPRLVDGGDVLRLLGGAAGGPRVGALLEAVREAQVEGRVRTRDEALALLRAHLA